MKVALLDGKHTGPICCLQFNPKYMTFASACSNMVSMTARRSFHFTCLLLWLSVLALVSQAFWLPTIDD